MQWWKLRRRVHVSWLIAVLSVGIVVGVIAAQWWNGWNIAVWLVAGIFGISLILWRRHVYLIPLIILCGVLVGLWRGSIDQQHLQVYTNLRGSNATLTGHVIDDVDTAKTGGIVLRLGRVISDGNQLSGKIWVTAKTGHDVKRGDIVTVRGTLQEGFGSFTASIYRAEIVALQRPEPGDVARRVRDWFADTVRTAIPDPQAALGIGYLVGQRRALPPELDQALQIAGLTHIVVASGYNLTILVRLARRLFVSVSKYLSALSAGTMILAFVAITGASPSMSRAGLVAGLSLAAWYYGRSFHPLVLLPFAAAVTVVIEPSFAWNDLGWQLSFAAFAGVMILAPLLQRYFFGDQKPGTVRQILGETVSAFVITLPILAVSFGQISNVAIVANLLVLPFVPLAMLLTFIAGMGAIIAPGLAGVVGGPATWLLSYMTWTAEHLSKLSWALTEVEVASWVAVVSYVFIIGGIVYLWRATRYNLRESNIVE